MSDLARGRFAAVLLYVDLALSLPRLLRRRP